MRAPASFKPFPALSPLSPPFPTARFPTPLFPTALFAAFLLTACDNPSVPNDAGSGGSVPDDGGTTTPTDDGGVIIPDDAGIPDVDAGVVDDNPTHPTDDSGNSLPWPDAPLMEGVLVATNRDSAKLVVPPIAGAEDYRVFPIPEGVSLDVDADGHEKVNGTTLYCAGFRQHNAPAGPKQLLTQIEVTGLTKETRLVVEAIDATCPFPGPRGAAHASIDATNPEIEPAAQGPFDVYTSAEIAATYGSLIVNGHAPGDPPGAPAPLAPTKVLARTTLKVTPAGYANPPAAFFEDFADPDQPTFVKDLPGFDRSQQGKLFENDRFTFATYGAAHAQFFIDGGRLHTVLADWGQDIMSSNVIYPREAVHLSETDYLHVTFEVPTDATARRYWWLFLCGAATEGATLSADGTLLGNIIQTPFFYQDDGLDPSVEGWNCLQIFPRDGYPFALPPDDTNPESDVRVMVNLPDKPIRENVVNVSPPMYDPAIGAPSWYRQRAGDGTLTAPILDDQLLVAPSTHYDLFIRRDRVVLFVDGAQRLCNDFPDVPLTMPEAALGFAHVLYHSAAERGEFFAPYWDRTGQRYYLDNTPFIDVRAWDNLGFTEHVASPPPAFHPEDCFVHHL